MDPLTLVLCAKEARGALLPVSIEGDVSPASSPCSERARDTAFANATRPGSSDGARKVSFAGREEGIGVEFSPPVRLCGTLTELTRGVCGKNLGECNGR